MTPSYPFTRRQALAGAAVLLVVIAVAGRWLLRPASEAGALPVEPIAAATTAARPATPEPSQQLVVHVVGAVAVPGLYRLDEGSRVADAVSRAGGPTRKADLAAVNLAAPLADGTQVIVPKKGQPLPPTTAGPAGAPAAAGPIHLNTATAEELDTLPGVGPVTAQHIIEFREQNGPFRSVDELDAVPGIGAKRLEELRELVVP